MNGNNASIKVVLLAAGLGTRLRPITERMPKVMVPIAENKPALEHVICLLRDQGFKEFVVNLHYLPERITEYFGDGSRFGVAIHYSDEREMLLETGGAIKKMEPFLSDTFLLVYADNMHFFDFRPLIEFHRAHDALATIVLGRSGVPQDGDIAEIDPQTSRIVRWHKRPHAIYEYGDRYFWNGGLYALSKKILDYIPEGRPVRLDFETIPALLEKKEKIFGFVTQEEILDMGTPEKYESVKQWYARRTKEKE